MSQVQYFTETLVVMHCGECGITFGVTQSFYDNQRDLGPKGSGWYCPNGHSRVFSYARGNELKDQLEREKERNDSLKSIVDRQRETIKGRDNIIRAQKAAKTRMKNRIHNGVCPCCNRTFENLARHMKTKHPEFVKE